MTSTKKSKEPKKVGRPSDYTQELGELICQRIATHDKGLPRLCAMYDDMPAESTINRWRYQVPEFRTKYAQAKMIQADLLAEQCLEIADDDSQDIRLNDEGYESLNGEFVARSRVRIDTRKWLASKLLPKQYGDKLLLEQKTEENDKLKAELMELRDRLDAQNRKDF
ncbi:MAG TPA: hypothetical protein VK616_12630 [Flavitalea sp.]|nr:hypothetical protein [Flavitalea sp.]